MTAEQEELAPFNWTVDGYSPPIGYWMMSDLMRRLLVRWWGERCHLRDAELFGETAMEITRRLSNRGTPLSLFGINGSRRENCSSESQKR